MLLRQNLNLGDNVTIRFRTARNNADGVDLVIGDEHLPMELTDNNGIFDYYSIEIPEMREKFRYYFEIHSGRLNVVYNRLGILRDANHDYDFQIVPGFKTPDWAKGAVIYQIFVDRFNRGDPEMMFWMESTLCRTRVSRCGGLE